MMITTHYASTTLIRSTASCPAVFRAFCVVAACLAIPTVARAAENGPPAAAPGVRLSFERDVRPILKTHCFYCHGEGKELEGTLDARLRRFLVAGGESGPAVVPGNPNDSLLLTRLRDGDMPPEELETRPTAEEITTIERWIAQGAATLRDEPRQLNSGWYVTEDDRRYWAFQPIRRPPPPTIRHAKTARTPVDQFVLARLEDHGLSFSGDADRRTLIRRASLDLIGLPPAPEDVERFVADPAPDAYERLIDRLLNSPHYGERWGRHWLDVAGYADSEGANDADAIRPDAFKYRDYVIGAFNSDMPFDQFICEQLAGDEMVRPPYNNLPRDRVGKLVATGFLRMAPDGTAAGGAEQAANRNQVVADTIQIVSTSLLGLTVGCAQCHNHRYDPISQADYYALRAVFEPALDWKSWKVPKARRVSLYTDADRKRAAEIEKQAREIEKQRAAKQQESIQRTFEKELAKLPADLREPIRLARDTPAAKRTSQQKQLLKDHPSVNVTAGSLYLYDKKAADALKAIAARAAKLRATKPKEEFVRALTEPDKGGPPPTYIFYRGDFEQPTDTVAPRELTVLGDDARAEIPKNDPRLLTTGRRLNYARWLTSGSHPLTPRVLVNRVWRHHFGRGIVETLGDFGTLGVSPTHPQLLDWLADEFVRSGWSLKQLHRLMMTSTVYRQQSTRTTELDRIDADNRWYGRMSVRRLEAETIRDIILNVSGKLNYKQGGPAVPVMADRVGQFVLGIENLNAGRPGPVLPMHGEEFRRSVYTQVRRSRPLSMLETFDAPAMQPNCTNRTASTVAPQSLMLMNSAWVIGMSEQFARRLARETEAEYPLRIRRAWMLAFGRLPSELEETRAVAFLDAQSRHYGASKPAAKSAVKKSAVKKSAVKKSAAKKNAVKKGSAKQDAGQKKISTKSSDAEIRALADVCHALLSSNEFLYID